MFIVIIIFTTWSLWPRHQAYNLIFIHAFQVDDDFLIALATQQSQIESLDIGVCLFTDDGLQNLRKVICFNIWQTDIVMIIICRHWI